MAEVIYLHPKFFFKYHFLANIFSDDSIYYFVVFFGKFIYNYWTNNKYVLSNTLMFFIIADAVVFNSFNSLETFIKSINKFLYSASIKSSLSILTIILYTFALFTTGYSFLSYFVLNIISSIIIFNFYFVFNIQNFEQKL